MDTANDHIFIKQLRFQAIVGLNPEERLTPQPLCLDIELEVDTRAAIISDDIAKTVDYDVLSKNIIAWASATQFQLVEALADYLAGKILQTTSATSVRLRLSKFPPQMPVASVGVVVRRSRQSPPLKKGG